MKFDLDFIKNLSPKPAISYGLDIGSCNIKLLSLAKSKEGIILKDCLVKKNDNIHESLSGLVKERNIAGSIVNVSLSGSSVISRYVNLPSMEEAELKSALNFEAEKHIPFSISECVVDAAVLKGNLPEGKMLVLIAAAKKDFLTEKLELIQNSGLKINSVDIDSVALINAFTESFIKSQKDYKSGLSALLNIGASGSSLNILEDNIPVFNREIPLGGDEFTKRISTSLGIDFQKSEEIKHKPGDKLSLVKSACEPAITNLVNEVRISFDYFETRSASGIKKVFLSGGGSELAGLDAALKQALGLEFIYWNPLLGLKLDLSLDSRIVNRHKKKLAVALGLAIR